MPSELVEIVKAGGAALSPFLLLLWWLERDERKSAQAELKAVTEKVLNAMNDTKAALATFSSILTPRQ